MPWVHLAKAWPGASARAMATASRPRSEAAAAACGSPHQGLLTRYWQVRASPTSASTLRGSRAKTARNHCWAWALSSARSSSLRVALARARHSLMPSSASAPRVARRLACCNSRTCSSREMRRGGLCWVAARASGRGQVVGPELVAAGPQIFGGGGVGDPHVDPQHAGSAALGAAGDDIFKAALGLAGEVAQDAALVGDRLERQPAAMAHQIGDEVVG